MTEAPFPFAPPDAAAADAALARALRGCARRDVDALRALHDAAAPALLGELLPLLGDAEAAEHALVQGLARAWREAARFPPGGTGAYLWLRALVRAVAIDDLRERDARAAPGEVQAQLGFLQAAVADEPAPRADSEPAGGQGLPPGLGEADRRLLALAWRCGRTVEQLAGSLGQPVAVLRRALRQGVAAFAAAMAADTDGGAPPAPLTDRLLADYVLGVQTARVRRRLARRLEREPALRRHQLDWERRFAPLAPDLPPVRPSDAVWKVLRRVAEAGVAPVARPAGRARWLLPLVAVIVLALAFVWLVASRAS